MGVRIDRLTMQVERLEGRLKTQKHLLEGKPSTDTGDVASWDKYQGRAENEKAKFLKP